MTIRALLFDIGGVLFRARDRTSRRKWEQRLGLAEGQLDQIVFGNPIARRATVGQATAEDVWQHVAGRLGLSPQELAELRVDFWQTEGWDEALLVFIDSLRPRLLTGTISDAWPEARAAVAEHIHPGRFDVILFSGEVGVRKPDPEIYRRALSRLEVAAEEAVFVDDRSGNVDAAQRLGMQGILFKSSEQVRREIERLLGSGAP
jgi:putative hydrolase of the HAD superfamily